ncbi:hypothetical protein ACU4HD_48085 [Cupriavidus basilensis]
MLDAGAVRHAVVVPNVFKPALGNRVTVEVIPDAGAYAMAPEQPAAMSRAIARFARRVYAGASLISVNTTTCRPTHPRGMPIHTKENIMKLIKYGCTALAAVMLSFSALAATDAGQVDRELVKYSNVQIEVMRQGQGGR